MVLGYSIFELESWVSFSPCKVLHFKSGPGSRASAATCNLQIKTRSDTLKRGIVIYLGLDSI